MTKTEQLKKDMNDFLDKIQIAIVYSGIVTVGETEYISLTQEEGNTLAEEAEALQQRYFPKPVRTEDPDGWYPTDGEIQDMGPSGRR